MEKLVFEPEEGNPVEFYVLEQTKLGGIPYILVTEEEEGDGEALILKDVSASEEEEAVYEIVEDETELDAVAAVFENMLEVLELHLIDRINLDDGFVRYEIGNMGLGTAKHHHHHLICINCGKVISFKDDLLEELENKITETTGFHVVDHEVKLYGYCSECGGKTD